jgi:hypothetical protein
MGGQLPGQASFGEQGGGLTKAHDVGPSRGLGPLSTPTGRFTNPQSRLVPSHLRTSPDPAPLPPAALSPTPGKGGIPGLQPPNFDLTPTTQPGLGGGPGTGPFMPLPGGPPVNFLPLPQGPFVPPAPPGPSPIFFQETDEDGED